MPGGLPSCWTKRVTFGKSRPKDPSDRVEIYAFLASQYLAGSILFLVGGVFNYWKAYKTMRRKFFVVDPASG
jgi:hypothetical protein